MTPYRQIRHQGPHLPTPTVPVRIRLLTFSWHLTQMAAQCFLFHSFVPFMPHFKTQINTTDTSSPPSLSVGSLACLWHARLFGTRLITARGLVINQGHVERDSRGPPVFQTIPPFRASSFPNNTPLISCLPL